MSHDIVRDPGALSGIARDFFLREVDDVANSRPWELDQQGNTLIPGALLLQSFFDLLNLLSGKCERV
jgi:hypothetical protein